MAIPQRVVVFGLQNWLGTPRLPQAFQRAGFEVALVHGANTLLGLTRFANRRYEIKDGTLERVVYAVLWELVCDWGATSIVAADDKALRLLQQLAQVVAEGQLDHLKGLEDFRAMLACSLPPPSLFTKLLSKRGGHELARAANVPVPVQQTIATLDDALIFAAAQGYPVVLKPNVGSSGLGVLICPDEAGLGLAHARLLKHFEDDPSLELLAESFLRGQQLSHIFVALKGRVLTGFTRLKHQAYPGVLGPSSVVELVDSPTVEEGTRRLVASTGYSGFGSCQFIQGDAGSARFMEFNPRPVPMSHMGEALVGVDACKAWYAAMSGATQPAFADPIPGRRIALFPQEWLRDHNSPDLRGEALLDVPWDDPTLLQAYLQQRKVS